MDEFKAFADAHTCKETLKSFQKLKEKLGLENTSHCQFFEQLSQGLNGFKVKRLLEQLRKRFTSKEYQDARSCNNMKVLIVGAGPCGLRTAIEMAFLGCEVVVIDKRTAFTRNNVLHLWPFTVTDLKNLGVKHFFGQFACGELDHISIRRLQLILLKIALIVGVVVYTDVEFNGLKYPNTASDHGWRCVSNPIDHKISQFQFDVLMASTGARDALFEYNIYGEDSNMTTLEGFERKEFRGKLSIAITANFVNSNTPEEMKVKEIGGVAKQFQQKLFKDLQKKDIQLENFVYYRDETHYFVMTAKKSSLLKRGVFQTDFTDVTQLLARDNIHLPALLHYVRDAANFCTNNAMTNIQFAKNSRGVEDVAILDFSSRLESAHASRIIEFGGRQLLIGLVGDSLLEPFWPEGTGCARGFLGAMDAAWMIKKWIVKKEKSLNIIAERESIYKILSQTTRNNIKTKYSEYTIDPKSRYQSINLKAVSTERAKQFYYSITDKITFDEGMQPVRKKSKQEEEMDPDVVLDWCQKVLNRYKDINVTDLTASWKSGCELGLLLHTYRPNLISLKDLDQRNPVKTMNLVVGVAERELGICPLLTVSEMITCSSSNEAEMSTYLFQYYEMFKEESLPIIDDNEGITMDVDRTVLPPAQEECKTVSDICYVCKKELFIVERINVENHFCHRGCLKCETCHCELNLNNYRTKKSFTGKVKFYCLRHDRKGSKFARSVRKRLRSGENMHSKQDSGVPSAKVKPVEPSPDEPKEPLKVKPRIPKRPDFLARKVTSGSIKRTDFYNTQDDDKEADTEEAIFEHNFGASIRGGRGVFSRNIPVTDPAEKSSESSESSDEDIGELVEANLGPNINKNMTIKDAKALWQTLKRDALQRNVINYLQDFSGGTEETKPTTTMDMANILSLEEENEDFESSMNAGATDQKQTKFPRPDDVQKRKSSRNEEMLDQAIKDLNRESKELSDRRFGFSSTMYRPGKQNHSDISKKGSHAKGSIQRRPAIKRSDSDQTDIRHAQRVQLAARKLARLRQQDEIFTAQEINRQLEEAELRLQEVEQEGVEVEKALKENPNTLEEDKPRLRKKLCLLYTRRQELLQYEAELMTANEQFETSRKTKVTNITNPFLNVSSDDEEAEETDFDSKKSDLNALPRLGIQTTEGTDQQDGRENTVTEGIRDLHFAETEHSSSYFDGETEYNYTSSGNVGLALEDPNDNCNNEEDAFLMNFWECPYCTLHNDNKYSFCDACYAWKCGMCTLVNELRRKKCEVCHTNKPKGDQRHDGRSRESFA